MCSSKKADNGWSPQRCGAKVADGCQRITERDAGAVGARERPVALVDAAEHAGGDAARLKPRSFLVGPVDDLDRREGLVARRMQGLQGLQRAQHAQRAVELAAGGLGVEVAAHGDRRNVAALPLPPREHDAHVVDGHRAAQAPRRGRGTSRAPLCRDRSASAGRCRPWPCRRSPRSASGCPTSARGRSSGCARWPSPWVAAMWYTPAASEAKAALLTACAPIAALFGISLRATL